MAECPVCNSHLYTENRLFPFAKIFHCLACHWKMDVAEVHRRGGLEKIKKDIASGKLKPGPPPKRWSFSFIMFLLIVVVVWFFFGHIPAIIVLILVIFRKKILKLIRGRPPKKPKGKQGKTKKKGKEWHRTGNLPSWVKRKMKKRRTNKVNGKHYVYLRKGKNFYRRRK